MIEIKIGFVGRATNGLEIRNSTIKSINKTKNTIYTTSQDVGGFLGKKKNLLSKKTLSNFYLGSLDSGNLSISKSEIQNVFLRSNSKIGGLVSNSEPQNAPFLVSIVECSITTTDNGTSNQIVAQNDVGGFIGLKILNFFSLFILNESNSNLNNDQNKRSKRYSCFYQFEFDPKY